MTNSLSKKLSLAVLFLTLFSTICNVYLCAQIARGDSLKAALEAYGTADTVRVKMLNDMMWFLRASAPSKAMQYGEEALALSQKLGYKWGLVKSYSYMGVCARNLNNYGLAAEMYLKHLLLAEELGSESEMFFAVNNIGNLYLNQEDWSNALKYALRNLPYAESKGTVDQKAYAYTNLGRCYSGLQQYDTAMEYFNKALRYQYQRKDTARIVSILNEIANIHFLRKNDTQSLQTHQKVVRLVSQIDERTLPKTLVQMAIIFQRRNMIDSSNFYARQSSAVALKVGRAETRATALRVLSENAASIGDFQRAYQIHIEFAAVRDSVLQLNGIKELSSLQARYEVEKKQREIEMLGNESRIQQTTRNIFIGGFVVVLAFAVLIGIRYREKFRTEAIIREQNESLQIQAAEISSINELLSGTNAILQESNEQLQSKNDQLAALNTEKNELMAIVSHDLKNPIGAIHTFAELLESKAFEGEEADIAIQQIGKITDRMLDLVKNLLDVNRLESGGMTMNLVEFDIAPLVEATAYQYATQAEAKNITVHFANETEKSIAIADEQATMQVLDNVISNAIKYSPLGKNVYVRIKKYLSPDTPHSSDGNLTTPKFGSFLRVEVQDEGPGISEQDMKKLFGKFARLSARPTGGEHSTGLGLSIVKKMVEAMNGSVWCESEIGKGATFIIELPSSSS